MSGGYSISVEELGWTSQAVFFFRTMLLGPSDEKNNDQSAFLSLHRGEDGIPKRTCDF